MKELQNDPMGQAILDYAKTNNKKNIIVTSEICEDDIIPASYLFRTYENMPKTERLALSHCSGRVLDVGAAAGMHAQYLQSKGLDVVAIDISPKAVEHLNSMDVNAECIDFFDYEKKDYDTLLFLMNGLGIAGTLDNLSRTLIKAKSLLNENGKILCDSSDIKYLYEDEEGGMWVDLNTAYYGNFKFQMTYEEEQTDWFEWLYVDFDNLETIATKVGLKVVKLFEEDNQYLAELTII
ncbi:MAG: methyltransferase domain-containing protein [Crocinitomicaceae bacterium]|nr:methyltransferase domain-containing protein [Crocinitomicaceae bacterium]